MKIKNQSLSYCYIYSDNPNVAEKFTCIPNIPVCLMNGRQDKNKKSPNNEDWEKMTENVGT